MYIYVCVCDNARYHHNKRAKMLPIHHKMENRWENDVIYKMQEMFKGKISA